MVGAVGNVFFNKTVFYTVNKCKNKIKDLCNPDY